MTGDPFVARQIGASAVSSIAHPMLRAMLTRFGSPRALFRALPIVVAKFDSTGTSRVLELGADHAVVAFGSSVVQEPNRHDCEYTHGLLTQASVLYGLPPAVVEETACQVDGAPECVFAVSWQAPAPSAMTSAAAASGAMWRAGWRPRRPGPAHGRSPSRPSWQASTGRNSPSSSRRCSSSWRPATSTRCCAA